MNSRPHKAATSLVWDRRRTLRFPSMSVKEKKTVDSDDIVFQDLNKYHNDPEGMRDFERKTM